MVVGVALLATSCGGSTGDNAELRLPADDEVCALMGADDLPGEAFETVPGSGSVNVERGGQTAARFVVAGDSSLEEGFVPADASCSWVGESGVNAGLLVLDYRDQPELLEQPLDDLVIPPLAEEHPLLTVEGFDALVVSDQSVYFSTAAGKAGPFVLNGHAQFLGDEGSEEAAEFLEAMFRRWLEAARATEPGPESEAGQ